MSGCTSYPSAFGDKGAKRVTWLSATIKTVSKISRTDNLWYSADQIIGWAYQIHVIDHKGRGWDIGPVPERLIQAVDPVTGSLPVGFHIDAFAEERVNVISDTPGMS